MLENPFTVVHLIELALIGGLTGFLSGMLGVGGGFVLVPLLVAVGVPIEYAVGSSLAYIAVTGASGAIRHIRQGSADYVLFASIVVASIIFAQGGAYVAGILEGPVLTVLFGSLMVGVALWFFFGPSAESRDPRPCDIKGRLAFLCQTRTKSLHGHELTYYIDVRKGLIIGAIVGFASGLFGVGGGFLTVPLVSLWMLVPIPVIIGSDLLQVVLTSLSGLIGHLVQDNVNFAILVPLIGAGVVLAQVGARVSVRVPQRFTRIFFIVVLALAAIYTLYNGLGELFFGVQAPTGEA